MLFKHIILCIYIIDKIYAIIIPGSSYYKYNVDCILQKKIGCKEKVKLTIQYAHSSKGAYLRINYTAFTNTFNLILIRKDIETIQVLRTGEPNHEVTVDDIYNGYLANTPSSYFYGTYSNGSVNGDLDDGDVTYHLSTDEEADGSLTVLVDNVNHATYAFQSPQPEPQLKHGRNRRKRSSTRQDSYKVCTLNIVITTDYLNTLCNKGIETCVKRVLWYINFVDRYFRSVDFNYDGKINNIGVMLRYLTVLPHGRVVETSNAKVILHWFKNQSMPIVCQHVLMLNQLLGEGTLGLAFLKSTDTSIENSAGVCYRDIQGNSNINSMLLTERSSEGQLPQRLVAITLLHELGHAFGSKHDTLKHCNNYRGFGNFVMYNTTMALTNPNVVHFSVCSRIKIAQTLSKKNGCFVEYERYTRTCGNYITTGDEECDCGVDGKLCEEFDKCCSPPVDGVGVCRINKVKGYVCSKMSSPCCNFDCQIDTDPRECRAGDECMESSVCDTHSYECPASIPRTDGTMCANGSRVCEHGKCTGSICRQRGWLDCFCNYEEKLMCTRCCRRDVNSSCKPVHLLDSYDDLKIELFIQESDVCNYDKGYCISSGKCQLFGYGSTANDYQQVKHFIDNYNYYIVYSMLTISCIALLIYYQV